MQTKKRLTSADRKGIETLLHENRSIRCIADYPGRTPSTISREIHNHTAVIKSTRNDCALSHDCSAALLCKTACRYPSSKCNKCIKCKEHCSDYIQHVCPKKQTYTLKLCNACSRRTYCTLEKHLYAAKKAQKAYRDTLIGMREGFELTYEELCRIDDLVSPLIRQGQSPCHIKQTLGGQLPVSESTLRRMIDKGELKARNIDLRNKVKRKKRKRITAFFCPFTFPCFTFSLLFLCATIPLSVWRKCLTVLKILSVQPCLLPCSG